MSEGAPTSAFQTVATGTSQGKYPPPYSIRFTPEERAALDKLAGHEPWSRYIRRALFEGGVSARRRTMHKPGVDDQALVRALGTLGQSHLASNLNQLAKAANMGALPVTPELASELEEACHAVKTMRDALIEALGLTPKD